MEQGIVHFFGVSFTAKGVYGDTQEPRNGLLAAFIYHKSGESLAERQQAIIGASRLQLSVR